MSMNPFANEPILRLTAPLPQAQVPVVMLDDIETIANVLQAEALPREQIGKADAEQSTRAPQRSDA